MRTISLKIIKILCLSVLNDDNRAINQICKYKFFHPLLRLAEVIFFLFFFFFFFFFFFIKTTKMIIITTYRFERALSQIQSTLVISKFKGFSKTLRDIRTSTCQVCRIKEKLNRTTTLHK